MLSHPSAPSRSTPPRSGPTASDASAGSGEEAALLDGSVPAGPVPLGADDRARLLAGAHHDPHALLGARPVAGGTLVRVLRPEAAGVAVVAAGLRAALAPEGDGLFSAVLPVPELADYRLAVCRAPRSGRGTEPTGERPAGSAPSPRPAPLAARERGTGLGPVAASDTAPDTPPDTGPDTAPDTAPDAATNPRADAEVTVDDPYRFLPALGGFDLHLIGEGRHEELWRALGARPMVHQGVAGTRFTVWAPNARGVRVVGDFCDWDGTGHPMRSLGASGVWELFVPDVGPGTRYQFAVHTVDGRLTSRADPMARRTECPPATASVVDTSGHRWRDDAWMATRGSRPAHRAPMSVYELHLGSWRPGLSYRELAAELPGYVRDLGFTHVELMPPAEHPFGGSWGYQVTGYYAPTARLGTPDDFRFLVDALHQAGVGVLMDWVPAHFPRDDWALARFDGTPLYEPADPLRADHPDWGTLEFDLGRPEVRNFLVANAVFWCEEFHLDGLRVDAVASMLYLDYSRADGAWSPNADGGRENWDAVAMLRELNATVHRRCPGVVTVAEESTAWDGVTRPTDQGGLGFSFKWNMGWMHDSLTYLARDPVHRRHHHDAMTFAMVYAHREHYVLPISHDEVVHGKRALVEKAPGDWWQRRATHRAFLGFMWAHPGKQLLFMGQEFAQGAEWSEEAGPQWWVLHPRYCAAGDHRGVRDLVRDLNGHYRLQRALWERDTDPAGFTWLVADAADDNVFAFARFGDGGTPLLAVSNFSPLVRYRYRIGVPSGVRAWEELLNTDAPVYGGSGVGLREPVRTEEVPAHGRPDSIAVTLPPLATVWFQAAA